VDFFQRSGLGKDPLFQVRTRQAAVVQVTCTSAACCVLHMCNDCAIAWLEHAVRRVNLPKYRRYGTRWRATTLSCRSSSSTQPCGWCLQRRQVAQPGMWSSSTAKLNPHHDVMPRLCIWWLQVSQLCHGTFHHTQRGGGKLSEAEARSILIGLGPALPPPTMAGLEGLKTAVPQILPEVGRAAAQHAQFAKLTPMRVRVIGRLHQHPLHSLSHLCRAAQACVDHGCRHRAGTGGAAGGRTGGQAAAGGGRLPAHDG
jgi:hypothetical protein